MLALITILSVNASPMVILPPIVTLPVALILPSTCKLPVIVVFPSISTIPVPLGWNSRFEFETNVEITLPVIRKQLT